MGEIWKWRTSNIFAIPLTFCKEKNLDPAVCTLAILYKHLGIKDFSKIDWLIVK